MTLRHTWTCHLVLALFLTASAAAQSPTSHTEHSTATALTPMDKVLVGTWKSALPYQVPRSTDFDKSIWGPGASYVRDVQLVVQPTGDATLTISSRIVDARGKTITASASIDEAQLTIDGTPEVMGSRTEYSARLTAAQRRMPDDPSLTRALDGLKVRVATFAGKSDTIEVRVDTPEGAGSFWDTLKKQARSPARKRS